MSAGGQTALRGSSSLPWVDGWGVGMGELLLYGLDTAGEAAFTEQVPAGDRGALRRHAETRLADWPAVEIWDGPLCVVRLRRRTPVD